MSSNEQLKRRIGKRIEIIRKEMNLNKEAFAKKLGISGQYLGIVEKGKSALSYEKLKILCDISGYSADYVLFGNNKCNKQNQNILYDLSDDKMEDAYEILKLINKFIKEYGI